LNRTQAEGWARLCLNPFFIRSAFELHLSQNSMQVVCLNPFFIRSAFEQGIS